MLVTNCRVVQSWWALLVAVSCCVVVVVGDVDLAAGTKPLNSNDPVQYKGET